MLRRILPLILLSACTTTQAEKKEVDPKSVPRNCDEEVYDAKSACAAQLNKAQEEISGLKDQLSKAVKLAPASKVTKKAGSK